VRGRNSDNKLFIKKMGAEFDRPLIKGIKETYDWIENMLLKQRE